MTTSHESIVENWMRQITADGGIDRYDDLHVDTIDSTWKARDRWLEAGHRALSMAVALRDRMGLDLSVALAFSLRSGAEPLGVDFTSSVELQERFDWSPPSLYLFRRGQEAWRITGNPADPPPHDYQLATIDIAALGPETTSASGCYLIEFRREMSDEYSRSLFLAA